MPSQTLPNTSGFSQARQIIATIPRFSALPSEVCDALARQMIPRTYAVGQVICLEGEPGEYIYVLDKG